ncbi:helix-turn-helix transcriptional regulator [Facklamia hominis]|nr:helix-turn-helix transcriptional regulator [Facklamia hominis]WPJ90955.1 helix-turn-helix transcriptional regulator [Facklamia hominis]
MKTYTSYRIKEFREAQKMTQSELAEKSGVSRSIISELETGRRWKL